MKFTFKAQNAEGQVYEGEREAADKSALFREFRKENALVLSAVPVPERHAARLPNLKHLLTRISIRDKIVFAKNLGGMLRAGMPLSRALAVLERQTRNPRMRAAISSLNESVIKGAALESALAKSPRIFSGFFVSMVRAGEEAGKLEEALRLVSEQLERSFELRRKIRGALIYPGLIAAVMLVIGIILFIYVVPRLTDTFRSLEVELPLSTQAVIAASDFLDAYTLAGIAAIAGLAGIVYAAARSGRGKRAADRAALAIPLISPIVREAHAARTARTLSSLLSSGVPVTEALEITEDVVENSLFKSVLKDAREAVKKGESLSGVFRSKEDAYPPFLSEMVAVGEETGELAAALRDVGAFFEAEVDQKTKNLSTIVEPLLMVVVGTAVGFFAIAMITPIYSLMNSL